MDYTIINLWPVDTYCCICGKHFTNCTHSIAMYEGSIIPKNWDGEWAGFDACKECFELNEKGLLPVYPDIPCISNRL